MISTDSFLKPYLLIYSDAVSVLSLSTLIVQTLAVMFRETEGDPARLDLLSAQK